MFKLDISIMLWTCVICQLTTESEKTLNIHIQENKHKVTYEALKAKNQSNIVNFGSFLPVLASTTMTTDQPMEKPQKLESTNGLRGSTTTNHDEKAQGQPKSVLSSTAKESNQPTKQVPEHLVLPLKLSSLSAIELSMFMFKSEMSINGSYVASVFSYAFQQIGWK